MEVLRNYDEDIADTVLGPFRWTFHCHKQLQLFQIRCFYALAAQNKEQQNRQCGLWIEDRSEKRKGVKYFIP